MNSQMLSPMEDPEYPILAVNEALINAVIHRGYSATTAIHCIAYRNGLVVENPGGIPQAVPQHFSLSDTVLDSVLRNQRIVGWMRLHVQLENASLKSSKRGHTCVK